MGKTKFLIKLDKPAHEAHVGEVRGTVVLETKKNKNYKSIKVQISGEAETEWEERVREGEEERTIEYKSSKKYAKKSVVLWKNSDAPDNCLVEGDHKFPFTLPLEGVVPSSYKGRHGRIEYEVKAVIVKSKLGKDKKKKVKVHVPVHELLDLNSLPDVREPKIKQVEKTLGFLCCASGPITMSARIPRTGFFCDKDRIPLEVEIENGSNRAVDKVTAEIKKEVHYTAEAKEQGGSAFGGSRHQYDTLVEISSDAVEPGNSLSWSPDNLMVPSTDPTIANCSIISVKYYLKVEAAISFALDPSVTFPLTIGTVPLND